MKIHLTSLFFITAFVAVAMWGMGQRASARKLINQASLYVPTVAQDEIDVVYLTSSNDVVIAIGSKVSARITLTKRYAVSNVLHSLTIDQGNAALWIQTPVVYSHRKKEFGFFAQGKAYCTQAELTQVTLKSNRRMSISRNQKLLLMEAVDSQNNRMPTTYSLQIEAIDKIK